jgi:hypothetical protein
MADSGYGLKTLVMRAAELEDKLCKIYVTEHEVTAYRQMVLLMHADSAIHPSAPNPCTNACSVCSCPCGTKPPKPWVEYAGTFGKFGT